MSYIKKGSRFSFRHNKRYNNSRTGTSYVSNRPRTKGNIPMIYDKYIKLAKEASSKGDRIQAEYYLQFADHYSRIMIENEIKPTNDENTNKFSNKKNEKTSTVKNTQDDPEVKEEITEKNNSEDKNEDKFDNNENTIEAVSFISKPAKKITKQKN